jgi:large subunit ribosomal protein L21
MKYTIIEAGSKQYKIKEGDEILVEKIEGKEGDKVKFDKVLILVDGEKRHIGQPYVSSVLVEGKILSQIKGDKIRIATYKAKSRYRKVKGHRQRFTKIKIEKISEKRKSSAKPRKK